MYVSVVTCQEVLEYQETSYFDEYQFVLSEHISLRIKAYKMGNHMSLWCVYFLVRTVEKQLIFGQLIGAVNQTVSARTVPDSVMRTHA